MQVVRNVMFAFQELHQRIPNLLFSGENYSGKDKVWDYLGKRGITGKIAEDNGLALVREMDLTRLMFNEKNPRASTRLVLIFPHYNLSGELIDWWSGRYVDTVDKPALRVVSSDWVPANLQKKVKSGKMICPPKEPPHGFLSPTIDYTSRQQGRRVFICESAIKAINVADLKHWSVGLNGVACWQSDKHNIALIKEISEMEWKFLNLVPVILFDSDVDTNGQVKRQLINLASKIKDICKVEPWCLKLPKRADGSDRGFDDYRVEMEDSAALAFLEQEKLEKIDFSPKEIMFQELNSKVGIIMNPAGIIVEIETGVLMSRSQFTDVSYADYECWEPTGKNGANKLTMSSKIWITGDHDTKERTEFSGIDYMPGRDRIWEGKYNKWNGMGLEPKGGSVEDVRPWLNLLEDSVDDEWLRNWIISWFAYPLQNLGHKMLTALVLFGGGRRGKGQIITPIKMIYGENAQRVESSNLGSDFNSLYANKQLIHGDELEKTKEGSKIYQKLKGLITEDKINVNTKGVKEYVVGNCANLVITSNYPDCIRLDKDDGRICVIKWVQDESKSHYGDQEYWDRYMEWMNGGGAEALYGYLLDWDTAAHEFNPMKMAPKTPWKEDMIELGLTSIELWVKRLWDDPDEYIPMIAIGRCLWTAKELAGLYQQGGKLGEPSQLEADAMASVLKKHGFKQANGGNPIRGARYWVIKNREDKDWYPSPMELAKMGKKSKCSDHLRAHNH